MHTSPSVDESVMRVIAIVIGLFVTMRLMGCDVDPRKDLDLASPKVREQHLMEWYDEEPPNVDESIELEKNCYTGRRTIT
jgi:hypothetical protein